MWQNPRETADLVTFTEKSLMENFIFCAVGPLSKALTNANLWHTANRIWLYVEPLSRFFWWKLYSSDNHYTKVSQFGCIYFEKNCNSNKFKYFSAHWKYLK